MNGTGAKRNVCPGSCVSTGAKFPVAPVESTPMLEPGSSCTAIRQATTGPLWHTNQRQGHRSRVNVVPRRCTGVRHQEWTCFSSRAVSASDDAAWSYSCTQTCWSEALDEGTCCCRVFPRWTWTPHAAGNSHHLPVQHTDITSTFSFYFAGMLLSGHSRLGQAPQKVIWSRTRKSLLSTKVFLWSWLTDLKILHPTNSHWTWKCHFRDVLPSQSLN